MGAEERVSGDQTDSGFNCPQYAWYIAHVAILKVHKMFPKVSFPPSLHPVKMWRQTGSG